MCVKELALKQTMKQVRFHFDCPASLNNEHNKKVSDLKALSSICSPMPSTPHNTLKNQLNLGSSKITAGNLKLKNKAKNMLQAPPVFTFSCNVICWHS